MIHFYNNDLDFFPTFLPFSLGKTNAEVLIDPNGFYETCFRSFLYITSLLFFCFCVERQNAKTWLVCCWIANGVLKLIIAVCSGYRLSNYYFFRENLLDELQDVFRVVVFTAGVISIFHWNGRSTAMIKTILFMTSEFLSLLAQFLI